MSMEDEIRRTIEGYNVKELDTSRLVTLVSQYEKGEKPLSFKQILETSLGRYISATVYEQMLLATPLKIGLCLSIVLTVVCAMSALILVTFGSAMVGLLLLGPVLSGILVTLWIAKLMR